MLYDFIPFLVEECHWLNVDWLEQGQHRECPHILWWTLILPWHSVLVGECLRWTASGLGWVQRMSPNSLVNPNSTFTLYGCGKLWWRPNVQMQYNSQRIVKTKKIIKVKIQHYHNRMTELGPEKLFDIFYSSLQLIGIRRKRLRNRHCSVPSALNANVRSLLKKQTWHVVDEDEVIFNR